MCYKNNRNLRSENDFIHKKYRSLSKRFERLKIKCSKKEKDPSSPLEIINKFLHGKSVPADVRRCLVSFVILFTTIFIFYTIEIVHFSNYPYLVFQ